MPVHKLWTKDFVMGTLANFFLLLNNYLLLVVMSKYAMENLGSSPSNAGLATGIFVIGALFARLFSGQLIERMGLKRMLFSGTALSLVMTIIYLFMKNIWLLYVVRFVHGVGYGIASVAIVTAVSSILPKARQGEGIGYYLLSTIIPIAIGPFLAMFIIQYGSFMLIFLAGVLFAVLSLVNALSLSIPEIRATVEPIEETKGFKLSNFFEPTAIPISIVCALLYFAYSGVISFLIPYSQEIHLVDAASLFFPIFSFAILLSRPLTGRLFDSKGENFVMYPAFSLFGIGLIILGQTDHASTLIVASILLGLGFGIVQACGMATALKITPPQRIAFASSTFYVFVDVTVGMGPFILGSFIVYMGYRDMYLSMAVVSFACILVYYLLHGRKAVPPERSTGESSEQIGNGPVGR